MMSLLSSLSRHGGLVAAALCLGAGLGFATATEGYSHAQHPLALLGATMMPHAHAFNLLAFVLPGALVAVVALRLRAVLGDRAGWAARIGAQALLLSSLAFAAQGLLPLDLTDLESVASGRHAAAWMLWWIAFATGGALLALGLRRQPEWSSLAGATVVAVMLLPLFVLLVPHLLPAGIAQRIAFATWFGWAAVAGSMLSRIAASGSGSSATARV